MESSTGVKGGRPDWDLDRESSTGVTLSPPLGGVAVRPSLVVSSASAVWEVTPSGAPRSLVLRGPVEEWVEVPGSLEELPSCWVVLMDRSSVERRGGGEEDDTSSSVWVVPPSVEWLGSVESFCRLVLLSNTLRGGVELGVSPSVEVMSR